ncbi:transcription antiterminator BglG [Paenibacillus sp. DMB20]|nr:transcription antiterminator BglG [Paenibacillus sp. DMB20]
MFMLQKTVDHVSIEEVMQKLKISRRTVYYDMDKINDWLKNLNLPAVEYVRSVGYYLPDESRKNIPSMADGVPKEQLYLSLRQRIALMAVYMISTTDPLFVYHYTDMLQVSRGTVLKDLQYVREEMKSFHLEVTYDRKNGYGVSGEESDIRKTVTHYLGQIIGEGGWKQLLYHNPDLPFFDFTQGLLPELSKERSHQLYTLINGSEEALGVQMTDEMVYSLSVRFLIYVRRIQRGDIISIDGEEQRVLCRMPEYGAVERISKGLERLFAVVIPEQEVCYFTMHILGARVNKAQPMTGSDGMNEKLRETAKEMTDAFQRHACVFLPNKDDMEHQLMIHLKPAYYRILYGLGLDNPMLDIIRTKYREVFDLTRRAAAPFEKLVGRKLNDDEIGYLAMHFGGWLRRENTKPAERRKAAIVCVNGISASRMLKSQLESLFSALDITAVLSLREYETFRGEADFIFSTVPLPDSHIPVFIVNPILSDKEKEHLLNQINALAGRKSRTQTSSVQAVLDIVRKYAEITDEAGLMEELNCYMSAGRAWMLEKPKPSLSDLLTGDMITVKEQAADWRAAIRTAAGPLLNQGYIENRYVDEMIAKVEVLGPYIVVAPGIAIAHAKPQDGVLRLGISLLQLNRPVSFSKESRHQVHTVLVLASIDSETHLKALSELTSLLRAPESLARLKQAKTKQQILQQIQFGSKN